MAWRYIAARMNGDGTETFLDYNVPLQDVELLDQLSGPGRLTATVTPETPRMQEDGRPIFEPWSTVIYAEADGYIQAAGIVVEIEEEGPQLRLDCVGFTGYANDMPYTSTFSTVRADPLFIVRHIWLYLQAQPGGNLGMTVESDTSPVKLGKPAVDNPGEENDKGADPYELNRESTPNLGNEISSLARDTPFDYRVKHKWDGDTVSHRLQLAYPAFKRRRHDLRFVEGENIYEPPKKAYKGSDYADEVLFLGAGEGKKQVHYTAHRKSNRLRRVAVVEDKEVRSKERARAEAEREVRRRLGIADITEVVVIDHPHARLGSYEVGDEIFVQAAEGWTDSVSLWCRILSISIRPEPGTARLTLARAEKV